MMSIKLIWQILVFLTVAGADFYSQENEVFIPPFLQIESSKDEAGQSVMTTTDNLNTNLIFESCSQNAITKHESQYYSWSPV